MRRATLSLLLVLAACAGRSHHSTYIQPWAPVLCERGTEYVEVSNTTRYTVNVYVFTDQSHRTIPELVGQAPPGLTSIPLAGTSALGTPAAFEARRNDEDVPVGVRMIRRCDTR